MAKRSALGKGLGAFFGEDVVRESEESTDRKGTGKQDNEGKSFENRSVHKSAPQKEISQEKEDKKQEENVSRETLVKITQIEPNREQPRKNFDQESMEELADSMKEYGVIQPLLVKKTGEDRYQIIAGERRWRAAKIAGLKEVPVIVREYDRQQSVEIALIENVQRADLNPIEEAMAYAQLMEEFGMKQEEIAFRVSKNRTTIANSLRLLKLPETVRNYLITGELSSGHARAILGLPEPEQQEELAKRVVEKGLSVREVEKLVKLMTKPPKEKKENSEDRDLSFIFRDLEERMKGIMGTKVMIHQKDKNKGRIEIEYYSASELERIVELIESIK
ncbi:MAG TPA: ParB/RepB/Spo0J family partition protein [Candidatus Cottocaccamicrobium excrementipullorum]|nr:ParB/RepB/Spo0J family partition protein [Candidatus Cottocaccamicrobium excrementipullorum]